MHIKNVWQIDISKPVGVSTILNNKIKPVSETRLHGLTMTSVLSHWLTSKPFVLTLYKCDITRMVGRSVNSIAMYTSVIISLKSNTTCVDSPAFYIHSPNEKYIMKCPMHLNSPNIPSQPASHYSPFIYSFLTYISRAYISLVPRIYQHSPHLSSPHIYLYSLHLINPPHPPHNLHPPPPTTPSNTHTHTHAHSRHPINPLHTDYTCRP